MPESTSNCFALRTSREPLQGHDVSGFLESPDGIPCVEVNDVADILDEHGWHQLQEVVNPLSDEGGDRLYQRVVQFVGNYLSNQQPM